jgi:hypothetical protein
MIQARSVTANRPQKEFSTRTTVVAQTLKPRAAEFKYAGNDTKGQDPAPSGLRIVRKNVVETWKTPLSAIHAPDA